MDVNHVGITVSDIDAAVAFYTSVFDFEVLVPPRTGNLGSPRSEIRRDVFGPKWEEVKGAHLATPRGVGLEIFQFVTPTTVKPGDNFEYWKVGISHFALTVDDLEGTIARLVAAGGRRRSGVHTLSPGTQICYCEDPFGVVIELASSSYHTIAGVRQASDK